MTRKTWQHRLRFVQTHQLLKTLQNTGHAGHHHPTSLAHTNSRSVFEQQPPCFLDPGKAEARSLPHLG